MEALLYAVPVLIVAICLFLAFLLLRRTRLVLRTWTHGVSAPGRCLNTYTSSSGGWETSVRTSLHHVYEFRTREGRAFRFEEEGGPATVVAGDEVVVRYLPERPQAATALAPARGRLALVTGAGLVVLGGVVAGCALFMAAAHVTVAHAGALPY